MNQRKRVDYPLPAEYPTSSCKACGADIYFHGKMPLSLATIVTTPDGERRAESHFSDCPDADKFRRK